MNILAIDTSTRFAGVGLLRGQSSRSEVVWRSEQNHGRELMPAVLRLVSEAGLEITDITQIAVALGPGGFSAIRVGIGAATGLSLPGGIPLHGVTTFDIEARPFAGRAAPGAPVVALVPAGREEFGYAVYENPGGPTVTGLARAERLASEMGPRALFCGEGATAMVEYVGAERVLSGPPPTRSPLVLADIVKERVASGQPGSQVLQPVYAREPSLGVARPVV